MDLSGLIFKSVDGQDLWVDPSPIMERALEWQWRLTSRAAELLWCDLEGKYIGWQGAHLAMRGDGPNIGPIHRRREYGQSID